MRHTQRSIQPHTTKQVLPIPYTVVLLIMGLIIGVIITFGAGVHVNDGDRSENIFVNSISQWVNMYVRRMCRCVDVGGVSYVRGMCREVGRYAWMRVCD
jgi:hypothetical protein